ncbi:UNVERIFIED_CONTAM: hypothetical protein RKD50_000044, partial [Streptomyces canus]
MSRHETNTPAQQGFLIDIQIREILDVSMRD